MDTKLGAWAFIDIETSGIDATSDKIIDVGFIRFEGTSLVSSYRSLVRFPTEENPEEKLSYFIQKLTGINPKELKKAPPWRDVEVEIQALADCSLIAHNAEFESSFLEESFEKIGSPERTPGQRWNDSLYFLALLNPRSSSLGLEHYITKWGLREKEIHRGYEDSIDLLQVLLIEVYFIKTEMPFFYQHLIDQFISKKMNDYWFYLFFQLPVNDLLKIGEQIDFDLIATLKNKKAKDVSTLNGEQGVWDFDLEFGGEQVEKIFSNEKEIKKVFPHYQKRDSQIELAKRVGQSFKNKVHSMIQAPTGTGKTLGYLVPTVLFAKSKKEQVLISTGTKALQHQALEQDVPRLKNILGFNQDDLKVEKLVGSKNHYCELVFRSSDDGELLQGSLDFIQKVSQIFFENLFFLNAQNLDQAVTREEFPYVLRKKIPQMEQLYQDLAVDFAACTGKKCPYKGECAYLHGIKKAKDADVIIGNHALMFSWTKSFPRPQYIVVDEAHRLEKEATEAFSLELSGRDLSHLSSALSHLQGLGSLFYLLAQTEHEVGASTEVIGEIRALSQRTGAELKELVDFLDFSIESLFRKLPNYSEFYSNEIPFMKEQDLLSPLQKNILHYIVKLKTHLSNLIQTLSPHFERMQLENLKEDAVVTAFTRFNIFFSQLLQAEKSLNFALKSEANYTHVIKYQNGSGFVISSSPINIGSILNQELLLPSSSVVMTSATLANATGDMGAKGAEWSTGYLYLDPSRRFKTALYLPAVYDYKNRAKVFLCDDTPSIYDEKFIPKVMTSIEKILRGLGGRSLLLFSAKSRFEQAREYLLEKFEGEIPLFIQGMGAQVVEEFRKSGQGILLGMESFGEGIDIPGDALQFVFVDKIPDVRMDLVIKDRREFYNREIGNEFTDYYLSSRARSLQQKLGRLLRTDKDYGAVLVVDSRFKSWKKDTTDKFFKMMEPYQMRKAPIEEATAEVLKLFSL
jgi:ATP-dependent DNA helicase DinG